MVEGARMSCRRALERTRRWRRRCVRRRRAGGGLGDTLPAVHGLQPAGAPPESVGQSRIEPAAKNQHHVHRAQALTRNQVMVACDAANR